jgi:hypothetical protein
MKEKKTAEFIGSVIGNIVGLILVNTVLLWRHLTQGVILESWVDILWAANLSLLVQIVGNLSLVFYRTPVFLAFMKMLFAVTGMISIIVFYIVFPLDFSRLVGDWLNTLVRVVLMVGMGGALIGFIVELVRFIMAAAHIEPGKT